MPLRSRPRPSRPPSSLLSQTWTIAPSHSHFLTEQLRLQNVYLIPLWGILASRNPQDQVRSRPLPLSRCGGVVVNTFQYDSGAFAFPTNCTLYPSCSSYPSGGLPSSPSVCAIPKVLFFGAIGNSDDDRRTRLCELMTKEVPNFGCFEGVFGPILDRLIGEAPIIVLERFYDVSSLESHRIDPLLSQGKIIVSTRSFGMTCSPPLPPHPPTFCCLVDAALDREYQDVVIFVDQIQEMPSVILELLSNQEKMMQISKHNQNFILNKVRAPFPPHLPPTHHRHQRNSVTAICNALRNLMV
jgi:hypothetical protein